MIPSTGAFVNQLAETSERVGTHLEAEIAEGGAEDGRRNGLCVKTVEGTEGQG
jgi:hypothetical protein